MSHPLIELSSDREVKQAAAFRKAAQGLTGAGLAPRFEQERSAAPRLHEAGRRYFVRRGGKPALERRPGRDEEHLASALVRHCREGGAGLPLPDEGEVDLLDYRVRIKATRADDPETKGIGRIDLLGTAPDGRIAVVQLRYVSPTATRCADVRRGGRKPWSVEAISRMAAPFGPGVPTPTLPSAGNTFDEPDTDSAELE